jgi:uncharacterized protein
MKKHAHATHPELINRLKRAEGHLKKVIAMLESGENCVSVAQQLHGVNNALANAKTILIHDHIEHCLDEHLAEADSKTQKTTLSEFKEIAKYL